MNTFIGASGTINCPSDLGIMVKNVQINAADSSVTNVGITLSGVGTTTTYDFKGLSKIEPNIRFPYQAPVQLSSSGTLNTVIVSYVYYGDQTPHMNIAGKHNTIPIPTRLG